MTPGEPAPMTPGTARRLAVSAQGLAGKRPSGVLEVVQRLGSLQLDPINAVARSHLLVLWSRLGRYRRTELERLLWTDRTLFQWNAFVIPTVDWPLYAALMRSWPRGESARARSVRDWLRANSAFRRYVMSELEARGPLPGRALQDRASVSWRSRGWTADKNVSQMLEFLWRKGEVLVAGRVGQQRLWDLTERCLPPGTLNSPTLSLAAATRALTEKAIRSAGIITEAALNYRFELSGLNLRGALTHLQRQGVVMARPIEGVRGTWYTHIDNEPSDGAGWRGRTTLLSPFDQLIHHRPRTEALFDFRYRMEIYVPRAKRQYGYFVLPILDRDRLIGRIDPAMERTTNRLRINAVYAEPDAPGDAGARVATAIGGLARWLGASDIVYDNVAPVWERALR
jgi:uncharacterized protein YcaQ